MFALLSLALLAAGDPPPPPGYRLTPQCAALMQEVELVQQDLGIGDPAATQALADKVVATQAAAARAMRPSIDSTAIASGVVDMLPGGALASAVIGAARMAGAGRARPAAQAESDEARQAIDALTAQTRRYSDPRLTALYQRMQAAGC